MDYFIECDWGSFDGDDFWDGLCFWGSFGGVNGGWECFDYVN